jgi:hypothetical protein
MSPGGGDGVARAAKEPFERETAHSPSAMPNDAAAASEAAVRT